MNYVMPINREAPDIVSVSTPSFFVCAMVIAFRLPVMELGGFLTVPMVTRVNVIKYDLIKESSTNHRDIPCCGHTFEVVGW